MTNKIRDAAIEAAARAIWDTWCASPAGREIAPEGGALSWADMVKATESGKFPALAEMAALSRQEAAAAIVAYEAAMWRPIAEAPSNGQVVLLWGPKFDSPRTGWRYSTDSWQDTRNHHTEPTRFRYITPPTEGPDAI